MDKTVDIVDNGSITGQDVDYEALYVAASTSIAELTAERDSLRNENAELRTAREEAIADGAKARELNYTLARQLDIGRTTERQPEDYLAEMFLLSKKEELLK